MNGKPLYAIADKYLEVLNGLLEAGADEQTFNDTLSTFEDDVVKKGINVAGYFQGLDAEAQAIDEAIVRMVKRKKAITNASASAKEYLRIEMERTGITKIECPEYSISLGAPSDIVNITNAKEIPAEFLNVKTTSTPNKALIKSALKNGNEVKGAELGKGKSRLTIK